MRKFMTSSASSKTTIFAVIIPIVLAGVFFFVQTEISSQDHQQYEYALVRVAFPTRNVSLTAQIADTVGKRTLGLSGREHLANGSGMLFVFKKEGLYGFWMKDMHFAIDILWFDSNLQLVDMWQNASPDSYPKIVESRSPARYVLEVPAGFAQKYSLAIGDAMQIGD